MKHSVPTLEQFVDILLYDIQFLGTMLLYMVLFILLNLVLLLSSFAFLYVSIILIFFYLLPNLSLLTPFFLSVPYTILALGILHLTISICGIANLLSKYRMPDRLLKYNALGILHLTLLGLAIPLQLGSIFTTLHLRNKIDTPGFLQMVVY